jgi:uncharacterized protein
MPTPLTYPGVYIEEISSGVRTITGVSTSITAFVGYTIRGPVNKAIRIFNFGDYERNFGELNSNSDVSYAVQQFFLNGGADAYVVRVAEGGSPANLTLTGTTATDNILNVTAKNAGAWGNDLFITVNYGPERFKSADKFNIEIERRIRQGNSSNLVTVETERYISLSLNNKSPKYVVNVVNQSKLIQVQLVTGLTFSGKGYSLSKNLASFPSLPGSQGKIAVSVDGAPPVSLTLFDTTVATPIAKPDDIPKLITALTAAITVAGLASSLEAKRANENGTDNDAAGTWLKLISKTGGQNSSVQVLAAQDNDIAALLTLGVANGGKEIEGAGQNRPKEIVREKLNGGIEGNSSIGARSIIGDYGKKEGIYALRDVDLFNLLVIPATSQLEESATNAVIQAAVKFCIDERAFYIIDPPSDKTLDNIQDWAVSASTDNHAAVFFPRIKFADPLQEFRLRDMPVSGAIAGIFARTDGERGIWKAPAGTDAVIRGAQGLTYVLTDPENGVLNKRGINCLRTFPVYGTVIWGARTLQGNDDQGSEWKYIPVRRTALFLEESIYRGTQWVVFEPNDEPLWAQIRLNIGAFMNNLFRQGAFQGRTPQEAYFVKCNSETTTQNDINLGIVNIIVGFAPLKPAEFVVIKFQQIAGNIAT